MDSKEQCSPDANTNLMGMVEPCAIFILDEHLQRFPLESMDMMSNVAITRIPSLPFVFASLLECETIHSNATSSVVDPIKVKYGIDPVSIYDRHGPQLDGINQWLGMGRCCWENAILQIHVWSLDWRNGLYLYCDHGVGEKAFSRSQVETLMNVQDDGIQGWRAPVILMGCSSGKLQSVNMPKSSSSEYYDHTMHYEPEGIALTYLCRCILCHEKLVGCNRPRYW